MGRGSIFSALNMILDMCAKYQLTTLHIQPRINLSLSPCISLGSYFWRADSDHVMCNIIILFEVRSIMSLTADPTAHVHVVYNSDWI